MTLLLLIAFVVAFVIASVVSVGGLSGAFLVLPFQVSVLGFTGPSVTPTNHLYNVVAIPSGVLRYFREGRMLWPLTAIIAVGTVPGVIAGSLIRIYWLPDPSHFKVFVGCVLLLIGSRLASKVLKDREPQTDKSIDSGSFQVSVLRFDWSCLEYSFEGQSYIVPVSSLFGFTLVIGIIGGAYGIGGGAIIAPFLVSQWRLPVHTIAGATLFGTFLTSVVGVTFFWLFGGISGIPNVSPNLPLGLSFGAGGLFGTYAGARMQRHMPARIIEAMLMLVVSGLGIYYIVGFFV